MSTENKNSSYKNLSYLLPIAKLKNCKSFLEWRPFSKDKLSDIIYKSNNKCVEYYQQHWTQSDIRDSVPIVGLFAYDPLELSDIEKKSFEQINILLIDFDTLDCSNKEVRDNIKKIVANMGSKHYFVLSTGRNQNLICEDLCEDLFEYRRAVPFRTYKEQSELEKFFSYFGRMAFYSAKGFDKARKAFDQVPIDSKKPMWNTLDIISILNKTRDVAIWKGLSEPSEGEMESLAYNMIINEQAIANIKDEQTKKNNVTGKAIMDHIRQIDKIPITSSLKTPAFKSFHMLNISLNQDPDKLTTEQAHRVRSLGLEEKDSFAILFDKPDIDHTLDSLTGAVNVSKFSADLPDWKATARKKVLC